MLIGSTAPSSGHPPQVRASLTFPCVSVARSTLATAGQILAVRCGVLLPDSACLAPDFSYTTLVATSFAVVILQIGISDL